jgi:gamma-glutamyltranspeptidase/glutathione hydrolase
MLAIVLTVALLGAVTAQAQLRPPIAGTHGMVSSGHSLASLAGVEILKKGGNAFDAGVATHLAICILQPDYVGFVGVAPFTGYSVKEGKVVSYSGLGVAPKKATIEFFKSKGYTEAIPEVGILGQLIPATIDTDIAILQRYGTRSFAEVAAAAIDLAENGFPTHRFMIRNITAHKDIIKKFPYNASIFLPGGDVPKLNDIFYQKDAAKSLRLMVKAEQEALAAGKSRHEALEAVRDVFYKGEIAQAIVKLHEEQGGLFSHEDLANYRGKWEEPLVAKYKNYAYYTNSTWSQGPLLVQFLNMLENFDLKALGHNSADYVHGVSQVINLAMADREKFYGDPDFVKVPKGLWSKEYAKERVKLIDMNKAFSEMAPHGNPEKFSAIGGEQPTLLAQADAGLPAGDTTYLAVIDKEGNIFSMTPSDGGMDSPMVPGYGIILGTRLIQLRLDPNHAAALEPGKRPRLTPNPALVMKDGKPFMPMGTPGGDQQAQAMLQVFLNIAEFGMNAQQAIEAPRFGSYNFPDSFAPHPYYPGRLAIEERLEVKVGEALKARGHKVTKWPDWTPLTGAVCVVVQDHEKGVLIGGADPRREAYAIGW